jgi:hypothetical protein
MPYTPAHHQRIVRGAPIEGNVSKVGRGEERVKVADGFIRFYHGLEWRCDLLVGKHVPVDGFKEWMFLEFSGISFGTESMFRVSVQKLW